MFTIHLTTIVCTELVLLLAIPQAIQTYGLYVLYVNLIALSTIVYLFYPKQQQKMIVQKQKIEEIMTTLANHAEKEQMRLAALREDLETREELTDEEVTTREYLRNLEEHDRVYADGYFPSEITIYAPSLLIDGRRPPLSLYPTISSKHWTSAQRDHAAAAMGEIIEVKIAITGETTCVIYAIVRVDTPTRWLNICLHCHMSENAQELIRSHLVIHTF